MSDLREDAPPEPPQRPDDADCCRGGCDRCIFDIYEEGLARYHIRYTAWQAGANAKPRDHE